MRQLVVRTFALVVILIVILVGMATPASATCGGGGGGGTGGMMPPGGTMEPKAYVVPWKILKNGDAPPATPLVLYWFPTSGEQVKGNELLTSRSLTLASSQCVGMWIVPNDDRATLEKWQVSDKLPTAILVSDGKAIDSVEVDGDRLRAGKIEKMVQAALRTRETALDALLNDAKKKNYSGDRDGAVSAYQQVWSQRCLAPKKGRAAQKALGKLGVTVEDAQLRTTDPILTSRMNRRMTAAMDRAFAEELADHYDRAKALYLEASKIDPADPVPARFLGELYRHHTGEWTLARQTFEHLLTMQPDPLSHAVALHGLGKMTIHMGDSAKGLALFEQSVTIYPLALTYRNLAVYWNSERVRDKADAYVTKALALDPDEPYNLIFAATYLADSDRAEEALRIARENEGMLSASYNLAAIYALLGNKGKAMELLRRHFYEYERYDAVRSMEMWEARVDYVFATLREDPDFVELTKMAK